MPFPPQTVCLEFRNVPGYCAPCCQFKMQDEQATQSEGKKRRSFLPAPKKSSAVSPTTPQAPSFAAVSPSPSLSFSPSTAPSSAKAPSPSPSFSSTSSSSHGDREHHKAVPDRPQHTDSTKKDKQTEEPAFGVGLRVGAKVKIGGIKPGILRYLGTTHLAPGIFCGIELADPDGNHDGEVSGHRYFVCAPNHGIFAPKEKVCLDTSSGLGRVSSDSEGCYSSTESLTERTHKAFRSYEEGELEAVDCTKLSPILSPEGNGDSRYVDDSAHVRQLRSSRLAGKSKLSSTYDVIDTRRSLESLDSQESTEIPSKKQKSGLPRVKSSLPTASSSQSKLPTFSSRTYKYGEGPPPYSRSSSQSSKICDKQAADVASRDQTQEHDNLSSPRFRTGSARSSEDSEEDGYPRDGLSTGIKKQLRVDSRQYLNFTFDPEELTQSLETDSESDTKEKQPYSRSSGGNAANPLYSDPRFIRDISGDSSDESLGVLSPGVVNANNLCSSQSYMKVEKGTVLKEAVTFGGTSTPVYSQSRRSEAVKSDSYTVAGSDVRQVLDMSVSSSGTDEDGASLSVTRSISDSDLPPELLPRVDDGRGQGLSADFHTFGDQRLSQGYVPDTDSELGTLTTNSPNTDWVDRLGVTHPTSYAPLDQDGTDGPRVHQAGDREKTPSTPTASSPPLPQVIIKASDDDDSSDLTTHTEDDRIEADQVYGPRAQDSKAATSATPELSPPSDGGSGDGGETIETSVLESVGQPADPNLSLDSTVSSQKDGEEDIKDGKGSNKEESAQQRKSRPRKAITITKKRSENVDHKMPNTSNVTSRLADYIKAPVPVKPKEEKEKEKEQKKKLSKNAKNAIQKRMSITEISNKPKLDTSRASSVDRANNKTDVSSERNRVEKPEKPKPIIKRTPPKSKWGNIMSQIEASKDTVKPKPKSEIKSSLAAYLNTPLPAPLASNEDDNTVTVNVVKNDQQPPPPHPKREFKSRIKPLPPPPPKIDLSKIKSKLNVPTAASINKAVVPKRDSSPNGGKIKNVSSRPSRDTSPSASAVSAEPKENGDIGKRNSEGHIVLVRQPVVESMGSARSSHTDLSVCGSVDSVAESRGEDGAPSKRGSVDLTKKDRRQSTNSLKSEPADKARSRREQAKNVHNKRTHTIEVKSTIPPFTPIKIPSRAIEIRIGDGSTVSSQRSSPTPVIVKPIKPKPKSNAKTITPAKPAWGASKPAPPPSASPAKGRDSGGNQVRKPRVNGTAKAATTTTSNANHARTTTSSTTSAAQKEIIRLESLCEARTKELTHTKMQLKATTQGFDAMSVLVNYCCAELNAFECPTIAKKLETVQKQLTDCMSQIADLSAQKETLNQNLSQVTQEKDEASKRAEEALSAVQKEKEEHTRLTHQLDDTHNAALTTQRDELGKKHDEALKKLRTYYDKQIDLLKQAHDRQISDMKNESKLEMNGIRISHLEEIQELRNKHDSQMEELHKQHRNKLEDITHRFESIKLTLSEKVESLRGECDELGRRARNSEEALQRDADVKVQMALAPYLNLPKEIESLKTVMEMRNEEIQKLRSKNMDLEKQLEEIPIAREKIISLQQKVENLEAIINIKTDHEKQLHEKCQVLMRKYDRESRANKRLSMDYEQVMWRMSQSSEFGSSESLNKRHLSRSPPHSEASSPDPRRRNLSPNDAANGEVVMRVKKRSSHSISEGDRKLRSRSATFVIEKEESNESRSPSSSPQLKQKRWRKKSQTEELAEKERMERMCSSAGPELMSDILGQQKKAVEPKEKVAVKTEMTDSQGEGADMAGSCARSLSGVSDSGVYDSMTRSDMLNSSILSTDSEWAMTSANLSMTLDSTMDDLESGPQAGDYCMLNENSLVRGKGSLTETDSGSTSSSGGNVSHHLQRGSQGQSDTDENSKKCSNYEFQVSLPDGTDDVFNESFTIDGSKSTSDSDKVVSDTTAKLTSSSEVSSSHDTACDVSVSLSHTATHAEVTSSPSISCPKTS